ncbi:MAG: sensor histidine kinase [Acidimicrobiia bacterium]
MNLRSLRVRLTVLYGVISAVAVIALALVAADLGTRRIDDDVRRQLELQVSSLLREQIASGERVENDGYSWDVSVDDNGNFNTNPYGKPQVEPPLKTLAENTGGGAGFDTFTQRGVKYLAFTQSFDETRWIVTVTNLDQTNSRKSSLKLRIGLFSVAIIAAAAAAGWLLAGRSLRPAREALSEQRGFLADAAHEMRTPLAVIQASASQALSRPRSTEEYVRSLAEIRAASERAAAGVNELLDLARLDSGQVIPRRSVLRLDLLAEEVAASTRADGCTVEAAVGDAVVVDADMALLRQAIDNVVRNATRRADHVHLATRSDGRDGIIEVADNGPGFDPDLLPKVFDRYRRGDTNGSVGMGLAIVKAICAAHGGAVEAANRDGGGAIVRIRVPLHRSGDV